MSEPRLMNIPLTKIRENKEALRKVNRQNPRYIEMRDSVKNQGILNAVSVRELTDPVTNEEYYALIDGLHRYTAAKDVGLESIPASILSKTDAEVLEAQVIANIHKVETKPSEYSKQLVMILSQNPTLTKASLCTKLSKSLKWLDDRLGLTHLDESISKLVDDQTLNLTNAYMLSKLEEEEQKEFLDQALSQQPSEFIPTVNNRLKQIKDANRKGRDPSKAEFAPVHHLKKTGEIKAELEHPNEILKSVGDKTDPKEIIKQVLLWCFNMDEIGIAFQKTKHEDLKKKQEEDKKARQEEREKKKRDDAAKVAASLPV